MKSETVIKFAEESMDSMVTALGPDKPNGPGLILSVSFVDDGDHMCRIVRNGGDGPPDAARLASIAEGLSTMAHDMMAFSIMQALSEKLVEPKQVPHLIEKFAEKCGLDLDAAKKVVFKQVADFGVFVAEKMKDEEDH